MFDNIYLGHSIEEAELIGNKTFKPKFEIEQQEVLALSPKAKDADKPDSKLLNNDGDEDDDDLISKATVFVQSFISDALDYVNEFFADPLNTLSSKPFEAGLYSTVFVLFSSVVLGLWSFILSLITGSSSETISPINEAKEPAKQPIVSEKIEVVDENEETTSGAAKAETKATKRT